MLQAALPDLVALMSYRHGVPGSGDDMHGFYEGIPGEWTGIEASAFVGVTHPYCTGSIVPGPILTPISLPDSSYRPSPALSHHSQDYQYNIGDHIPPAQGLGITGPFPSNFPRTSAPHAGYVYASENIKYGMAETSSALSSQPPPAKQVKRNTSKTASHDSPSKVLQPSPGSVQRMEHERQHGQGYPQAPARRSAPGRGRDPEAEEQDAFVEGLREQNLSWKVIRETFRQRFKQDATEARLQMRLSRRRKERLASWDDNDIKLLLCAHGFWESEKYHFIAEKMKELGAIKTYTPEQCRAQLRHLEAKQRRRELRSSSPSAQLDPPHTPLVPRKRDAPSSPLQRIEEEERGIS